MKPVHYHIGCFPPSQLNLNTLIPLIGPAHAAIAGYEEMLLGLPDTSLLLSPLAPEEAVASNRIAGTQSTITEVLTFEAEGALSDESTPKKADYGEVLNYRSALYYAVDMLKNMDMRLSQLLIRSTHEILMKGVRGQDKAPGEYRREPDSCWIGPKFSPIERALYIPCPVEQVNSAMDTLESYIQYEAPDLLVQLAIFHAEFLAIHPFSDGNGRMGRLMIPLFMYIKGLLSSPFFYISEYFERHRDIYDERLRAVSRDDDWTGWCAFCLTAVTEQARANQQKLQDLVNLYGELRERIFEETRSQYGDQAIDWMFKKQIFRSSDFVKNSGIPISTAKRILRILRDSDLLRELRKARGRHPSVLALTDLLDLGEGRILL